jgi:hypothetical protein
MEKKLLQVQIAPSDYEELKEMARERRMPLATFVRDLLVKELERGTK